MARQMSARRKLARPAVMEAIDPPSAASLGFARVTKAARPAKDYMDWRPCPICGGERHRPLLEYEGFQFYTDAAVSKQVTIRQVQCLDCFGVFMNPAFNPKGFAVLFAEAGASYGSTALRQDEQLGWLGEHGLLKAGSVLLDIGCYEGSFLGKLPAGIAGIGVDIDGPAIERARQRHRDHQFVCADFESFEIGGPPDVITMFHVLEHLPRPVDVLRRLASLSTPRTRLLVEVPVVENVIFGDACGFLTVQHLTHFSNGSLRNAMRAGGWRILQEQPMPGYNGFRVIAEPAPRLRAQAEPGDAGLFLAYMGQWYGALAALEQRIRDMTAPRCILRGGGLQTEYLLHVTSLFCGDRQFLIADNDPLKQGKSWRGIPILTSDCLKAADWGDTQLVLSSYSHQEDMRDEARALGIPDAAVIALYDRIYRY